jgi:hypothetical protein
LLEGKEMDAKTVAAHWEANAETWTKYSRAGYDRYRDALNTPAFLAMLPAVDGLTGLDLGCGEGSGDRRRDDRPRYRADLSSPCSRD